MTSVSNKGTNAAPNSVTPAKAGVHLAASDIRAGMLKRELRGRCTAISGQKVPNSFG